MIAQILRIVFALVGAFFAVFFAIDGQWLPAVVVAAAVAMIVYTYIQLGPVARAFNVLRKGNIEKAEELLAKINSPQGLSKRHKGYYHFTDAYIHLHHQRYKESGQGFEEALAIGLGAKTDRAVAYLNLAAIEHKLNHSAKAKEHLKKAKETGLASNLKEDAERLSKQIGA